MLMKCIMLSAVDGSQKERFFPFPELHVATALSARILGSNANPQAICVSGKQELLNLYDVWQLSKPT